MKIPKTQKIKDLNLVVKDVVSRTTKAIMDSDLSDSRKQAKIRQMNQIVQGLSAYVQKINKHLKDNQPG